MREVGGGREGRKEALMRCLSIDVVVGFVAVIGAGIGEIGRGGFVSWGGRGGVCGERCEWVVCM